jgi:hypothetical protein
MNNSAMNDLHKRLESIVGNKCIGLSFGEMSNCSEQYIAANYRGYHELTWGVVFDFGSISQLVLTWGEDKHIGDPFFLSCVDFDEFMSIDSLEVQDVSKHQPWDQYVGNTLRRFEILTYSTNYPGDNRSAHRKMPWAVELEFDLGAVLIGALHHGDFLEYVICADEVVIVQDATVINKLKQSRFDLFSNWERSAL